MSRRKGAQGHPARLTRQQKRHARKHPTERDLAINELVATMRRETAVNFGEGLLVGALGAAAKQAAPHIAKVHGLDDEEHQLAIGNYLTEQLAGVIDGFDPVAYRDWRQDCLA